MAFELQEHWLHPEGIFPAQLVETDLTNGQYGERAKWVWETNAPREDGKPPRLSHWTGTKFGSRTNLNAMLTAIGISPPETPEEAAAFDPDVMIGTRCRIQVEHTLSKDGTGTVWANIKAFAPVKKGEPLKPPPARPEPMTPGGFDDPNDPFTKE